MLPSDPSEIPTLVRQLEALLRDLDQQRERLTRAIALAKELETSTQTKGVARPGDPLPN